MNKDESGHPTTGPHRWATWTFAATLFLIFWGGTVTSNDAGMAVPDWPTTFGWNMFLYPPSLWKGGVLFEHVHRLAGAAVGLLTIGLAIWSQMRDPRRGVRVLGWVLLAGVIAQGVLGGVRVRWNSTILAIVHACMAQLFLSGVLCHWVMTSRDWSAARATRADPADAFGRRLCLATTVIVFAQLVAGAVYRHLQQGLATHVLGAVLVTVAVGAAIMWASGQRPDCRLLLKLVKWITTLLVVQLTLGVGAYMAGAAVREGMANHLWEWFVPSLHVAIGAAILATSAAMTMVAFAALGAESTGPSSDTDETEGASPLPPSAPATGSSCAVLSAPSSSGPPSMRCDAPGGSNAGPTLGKAGAT